MTMEENAELPWTSDRCMEMVELQQMIIAHYDAIMAEFQPARLIGFGINLLKWVNSSKNH